MPFIIAVELAKEYQSLAQKSYLSISEIDRISDILILGVSDNTLNDLLDKVDESLISNDRFTEQYLNNQRNKSIAFLDAVDSGHKVNDYSAAVDDVVILSGDVDFGSGNLCDGDGSTAVSKSSDAVAPPGDNSNGGSSDSEAPDSSVPESVETLPIKPNPETDPAGIIQAHPTRMIQIRPTGMSRRHSELNNNRPNSNGASPDSLDSNEIDMPNNSGEPIPLDDDGPDDNRPGATAPMEMDPTHRMDLPMRMDLTHRMNLTHRAGVCQIPPADNKVIKIDFEADSHGTLEAGEIIDNDFSDYGLVITTDVPDQHLDVPSDDGIDDPVDDSNDGIDDPVDDGDSPQTVHIDFETDGNHDELNAGEIIDDDFIDYGVVITTDAPDHPVMIFDTENPTGGDYDLGNYGGGKDNVLIISEDGDSSDPDDNAEGGSIVMTFDELVGNITIGFLDTNFGQLNGSIEVFDDQGILIRTVPIPDLGNNKTGSISLDFEGVAAIRVNFQGTGAITKISYEFPSVDFQGTGAITEISYEFPLVDHSLKSATEFPSEYASPFTELDTRSALGSWGAIVTG